MILSIQHSCCDSSNGLPPEVCFPRSDLQTSFELDRSYSVKNKSFGYPVPKNVFLNKNFRTIIPHPRMWGRGQLLKQPWLIVSVLHYKSFYVIVGPIVLMLPPCHFLL